MATLAEALAIALQHHHAGRWAAAEEIYRRILSVEPKHADGLHLLGVCARQRGQPHVAIELMGRAIEVQGNKAEFHNNLGGAFKDLGKLDEAIACYRRALELAPDFADACDNLGMALHDHDEVDQAIACYRRALELRPDFAEAWNNLGMALEDQGQLDEGVACYCRAIQLAPGLAEAYSNVGAVLKDRGRFDEAIACFQSAVQRKPDCAVALDAWGCALREQGALTQALDRYRQAAAVQPDYLPARDNRLYTLLFCPEQDAEAIYHEHFLWSRQFAAPLAGSFRPHTNDRRPDRRLRVGYVSPHFRHHVVGYNILPLLREHDHRQFEIYVYSDVRRPDTVSERLRAEADVWRRVVGIGDGQLSEQVREDGIDILVDLTLHMAGNRLLAFARKPAPVQITFAGYPGTTGISAIDYRLSDPYLDPPGADETVYSEATGRLPETFWCYAPLGNEPTVRRQPAAERGYVTFGCLNHFVKVNPQVLRLWACVLRQVENSRLLLLAPEGTPRHRVRAQLANDGVPADRVAFVALQARATYFDLYHDIDIALDTWPYNGHTTSLDSFYMGVPVVTLVGRTVVGRAGLSQAMNLGLPELVARTPEEFVRIAAGLAGDLPRLAEIRGTLRERMQRSPLMDAPRFARHVEAAYREMWRRWSAGAQGPG